MIQKPKKMECVSGCCFSTESKIERYYRTLFCFSGEMHVKGFCFKKYERSWQKLQEKNVTVFMVIALRKKETKFAE